MIIVSQDKMEITESSELKIDYITRVGEEFPKCDIEIIGYYIMNKKDNTVLGKYSTEERAKEVLEEIIRMYKVSKGMSFTIGDEKKLLGEYENEVYYMPTE